MLDKFIDALFGYLKEKPYWAALQPFVVVTLGFVAVEVFAYQYIASEHGFTPSLPLFLKSYISVRIIIAFFGSTLVMLLFKLRLRRQPQASVAAGKVTAYFKRHQRVIMFRTTIVIVVLTGVAVAFDHFSPRKVSHIRIKLLDRPREFDTEAFAYLIYELNRFQKNWYFEFDFTVFNPAILTSEQAENCERSPHKPLCQAQAYAAELGKKSGVAPPLIGITTNSLGDASFWQYQTNVSVISTADSAFYAPLSTYEYLMHCVIVQSILLHLDANSGGLPDRAYEESAVSHGGVFQSAPRREAVKSSILAARLSPREEELLFNRFGPDYMNTCKTLLSLEWFHSERVKSNLTKNFGVKDL